MTPDSHDLQWVERMRQNDPGGLEALFRLYYDPLCRFAYPKVKDWDIAEDLVQEVFVKLWNRRENLHITSSLKAYLFTATKNLALNHIQQAKRQTGLEQNYLDQQAVVQPEFSNEKETDELEKRIRNAIDALPPKCREVFQLSRFEGLTYQEIADEMGIAKKTVENQMGKALSILREQLATYLILLCLLAMIWLVI